MLNEKFTFCFKITIKWNLIRSHTTRLKPAKYKTHVIKEQLFKWMGYNKMNQSHSLSIIWWNFGKDCLFLFKGGWSLWIRRLFINMTLKSLLLIAKIEKSSKPGAWLQNKRCSLMAESSSRLTLFSVSAEIPTQVFTQPRHEITLSFTIIDSIAATALICKQCQNVRTMEFCL